MKTHPIVYTLALSLFAVLIMPSSAFALDREKVKNRLTDIISNPKASPQLKQAGLEAMKALHDQPADSSQASVLEGAAAGAARMAQEKGPAAGQGNAYDSQVLYAAAAELKKGKAPSNTAPPVNTPGVDQPSYGPSPGAPSYTNAPVSGTIPEVVPVPAPSGLTPAQLLQNELDYDQMLGPEARVAIQQGIVALTPGGRPLAAAKAAKQLRIEAEGARKRAEANEWSHLGLEKGNRQEAFAVKNAREHAVAFETAANALDAYLATLNRNTAPFQAAPGAPINPSPVSTSYVPPPAPPSPWASPPPAPVPPAPQATGYVPPVPPSGQFQVPQSPPLEVAGAPGGDRPAPQLRTLGKVRFHTIENTASK